MNNYINILLISGTGVLAGIINYAYHPLMLRFLSLEDFGTFGSLVGIFNLLGVLLVGLDFFFTKTYSKKLGNMSKLKFEFYSSFLYLGILGLVCYLVFILFAPVMGDFLKIDDISLFYITGLVLVMSFVGVNIGALLKSLRAFKLISVQQIVGPLVKLGLGIVFLYFGFRVSGALMGFVLAGFVPLSIGYYYIHRRLSHYEAQGNKDELKNELYKNKNEIFHFFLMSFVFAFFMNIDVILVKNIFSAEQSGIYAAVSVLGKFLIFLLLSIETVYYGQILEYEKGNIPKELIKNPLILMTLTIISAIIFNIFFGEYILHILKPELQEYFSLYIISLVFYGLLAYMSFFSKILIAWGNTWANRIFGFFIVLLTILVYTLGNNSIEMFVYCFIFVGLLCSISLGSVFFIELRNAKS